MEWVTSAGIDIGTSTTQLIVSHLMIEKVSSSFALPRFVITERKVVYESEVITTPLMDREKINYNEIADWLQREYQIAGIKPSDIHSGAVIITGETAGKVNAEKVVHELSNQSGEFVVAIAGPSLEGILAAKGSGAYQRSTEVQETIANIDIGGGTANVAIFTKGEVLGTVTFHVGGRLIEVDNDGGVTFISPSLEPWLTANNYDRSHISEGGLKKKRELLNHLCKDMLDCLAGVRPISSMKDLLVECSLETIPSIDQVVVSGGIGRLLKEKNSETSETAFRFGDLGPLLAEELMIILKDDQFKCIEASDPSRATVIGAGVQSVEVSGSTILVHQSKLPIKNVPVVKLILNEELLSRKISMFTTITEEIRSWEKMFSVETIKAFAISIGGFSSISYRTIQEIASAILFVHKRERQLIIVCEKDIGKALGQAILVRDKELSLICIDEVDVRHGDYLDIGCMVNDSIVPVVLKTLAFTGEKGGGAYEV